MVIHGCFGERGLPFVNVGVQVDDMLRRPSQIPFLIDTGADQTLLSYYAARQRHVSYANRGNPVRCSGVGGGVGVYPAWAALIFEGTASRLLMLEVEIGILM